MPKRSLIYPNSFQFLNFDRNAKNQKLKYATDALPGN